MTEKPLIVITKTSQCQLCPQNDITKGMTLHDRNENIHEGFLMLVSRQSYVHHLKCYLNFFHGAR